MEKQDLIQVKNRYNGLVGYSVKELNIHRTFQPNEVKQIPFDELKRLSYTKGGSVILKEYLEIVDEDVCEGLLNYKPEPEYHYTKEQIKNLMVSGSLDAFLDCLDFAPQSVKEVIKDMAIDLPLNDMAKRNAISEKLGFDVTKAIEIKNTKYDGSDEAAKEEDTKPKRRIAATTSTSTRRVQNTSK